MSGVVLEEELSRVALYTKPAYARNGILGSRETVYAYVHRVVSHPFCVGQVVRIGTGRTHWRVTEVGSQYVTVTSTESGRYRILQYGQLTQLQEA
ncbi:Uncharacterised protein [Mycobacteroides abscessus subsp. abscessus]|uniref:hypothetical protein n=1 Tax=Mycobacteroides abscessus TaxID=36809 RepID=UPI0009271B3B|nr:hypothetical protein [Mycobacteroides abscessus]SIH34080.1 Uncharacterised protein [Mycobacteroides abscessus subsp. abscessus]